MVTQAQRNRTTIEHFFEELWFGNNYAVIDQKIAKDAVIRSPLLLAVGPEAKFSITDLWFQAFPKVTNITKDFVATADTVMVRWHNRAVQKNLFCGVEPRSDAPIEYEGVSYYKLRANKIVEYRAYVNLGDFYQREPVVTNDKLQLLRMISCINGVTLTTREVETLSLWVCGATAKQSARMLNISDKTIEFYRSNLRNKLQFINKDQLFDHLEQYNLLQSFFYFGRRYIVNFKHQPQY